MLAAGLKHGGELLRDHLSTQPLNMALNSGSLLWRHKSLVMFLNRVYVCVHVCACICVRVRKEAVRANLWLC